VQHCLTHDAHLLRGGLYLGMPTPQTALSSPLFETCSPLDKLVWLYIALEGQGSYSRRGLSKVLGISESSVGLAFEQLLRLGLLEVIAPATGSRSAVLKVAEL
jgi:hypothetical protein